MGYCRDLLGIRDFHNLKDDGKKFKIYSDLVIKDMQNKIKEMQSENLDLRNIIKQYQDREEKLEKQIELYRKLLPKVEGN